MSKTMKPTDIKTFYQSEWGLIRDEAAALFLESGWSTANLEIGNKNGELYALPAGSRLLGHINRIYIRPDGVSRLVIRITLSTESSLKNVHAAIVKSPDIPATGKKVHNKVTDEKGDLCVEYVFLHESFVDVGAASSRMLAVLRQQWLPAMSDVCVIHEK